MNIEQKVEEMMPEAEQMIEGQKNNLLGLMTAQLMELKINSAVAKSKLSISDLETRALNVVKNEDHLKEMALLLEDIDKIEDIATETHKTQKKPYIDGGKAADEGKKLVFENTDRIRDMVKPDYDRILAEVDTKKRNAARKEAQDKAIKKGIEDTAASLAKRIAEAGTWKELSDVERLINLEKSPSRVKKYGDFHPLAIKRYDEVLMPVIKSQKIKVKKLTALHGELEEAVSDSETEEVDKLKDSIEEISGEMRQNKAVAEDILNQEFFPVEEVEEVLPEIRTKRTDISFELADAAVALKKAPGLLIIELNNKAIRKVAAKLKKDGAFDGVDELIVDGIKYIVTRQREAL